MIELAPRNKLGLPIRHPLMVRSGFFGYHARSYESLIPADCFGAICTNPITLRPRKNRIFPPFAENAGSVIFSQLPSNPGVRRVIQQNQKYWRGSATPIIAHLPADAPDDLFRTVRALSGLDLLAGLELGLSSDCPSAEARQLCDVIRQASELPLFICLPGQNSLDLAQALHQDAVDGLIISSSNWGAGYTAQGDYVEGNVFGLGQVAQSLPLLKSLRASLPNMTLIASGGIHSLNDARQYLQAGATALQVDSLLFTDPRQAKKLAEKLQS